MNIFVLDQDIYRCAQAHCDQHVGKMVLESVQILCTALHGLGVDAPYLPTHRNHPCIHWAMASRSNLFWLAELARALNDEFCWRYRRERDHASIAVLQQLRLNAAPVEAIGLTPFAQAMPEQYRMPDNPVAAYRRFYCADKARFARWTRRAPPNWFFPLEAVNG
ncbi:MAG TPA: hypothetical protein VIS52_02675 [Motiliproteus sp.]